MKSNLLLSEIQLIQSEYKKLLAALLPKLKSCHASEALDEINLFWFRHIGVVRLYLMFWYPGEDSYVFTAANYMNFDKNEHFPFLLIGKKHVFDDTLASYSISQAKVARGKDAEFLYENIRLKAEDNLKLLESAYEEILILPFRFLDRSNDNALLYKAERSFISLFNGINDISDYFKKCRTIEDIVRFAREDIGRLVKFSETDDSELPLEERFKITLSQTHYMVDANKPDSYNFFVLVFGCMRQAIEVIVSCMKYGCVPYIRYPVSLHYILLLSESISDIKFIKLLRFKMKLAFAVHYLCDKDKLAGFGWERFLKMNQSYDFNGKLTQTLGEHNVNGDNFVWQSIHQLITDELEKFYDFLGKENSVDISENQLRN